MKRLLLCVMILSVAGCGCEFDPTTRGADAFVSVIRVRGCEYVQYRGPYAGGITHAGDCDNHDAAPKSVRVRYIRPDSVAMGMNSGMVLVALDSTRYTVLPAKKDLAR